MLTQEGRIISTPGTEKATGDTEVRSILVATFDGSLGLGWRSALAAALFLLDNGDCSGYKLNTTISAVGPCVQLPMVVEVILSVELVFTTELA